MDSVRWQPWSSDAFARARDEDRPVLLSIATTWCESCLEMDRTTYADPQVAAIVNDAFVPIRVDADHRPDISDRYTLGGWPTTAFLTADGDVIGGGTFVARDRMASILDRVAEAFKARRDELKTNPQPIETSPRRQTVQASISWRKCLRPSMASTVVSALRLNSR